MSYPQGFCANCLLPPPTSRVADRRIRKAAMQVPPGKTKEVDDENPCRS